MVQENATKGKVPIESRKEHDGHRQGGPDIAAGGEECQWGVADA